MAQNQTTVRISKPRRTQCGDIAVAVYVNGTRNEGATYYTDDMGDARATRAAMLAQYRAAGATIIGDDTPPALRRMMAETIDAAQTTCRHCGALVDWEDAPGHFDREHSNDGEE